MLVSLPLHCAPVNRKSYSGVRRQGTRLMSYRVEPIDIVRNAWAYYGVVLTIFSAVAYISGNFSIRSILFALMALYLGSSTIRQYLLNQRMYFGWIIIPRSDHIAFRTVFFILGIACVILAFVAVSEHWN